MDATLHPTMTLFNMVFNGTPVPTRVWEGTTRGGIPITAFVVAIIPMDPADVDQLAAELPAFMVSCNKYLQLTTEGDGLLITEDPANIDPTQR